MLLKLINDMRYIAKYPARSSIHQIKSCFLSI